MRKIFAVLLLTFAGSLFAQNDTVHLNTPAIFSITFHDETQKTLFSLNYYTTYNEVYLDELTKDFITIRKKFHDEKNPKAISRFAKIYLKDLKSLGYATGTEETFGTVLGAGIGIAGGALIGILSNIADDKQFTAKNSSNTISSIAHPIFAFGGAGAILGYIFGGHLNSYESFDLTSYNKDNERKFQEINTIVEKGLKHKTNK